MIRILFDRFTTESILTFKLLKIVSALNLFILLAVISMTTFPTVIRARASSNSLRTVTWNAISSSATENRALNIRLVLILLVPVNLVAIPCMLFSHRHRIKSLLIFEF